MNSFFLSYHMVPSPRVMCFLPLKSSRLSQNITVIWKNACFIEAIVELSLADSDEHFLNGNKCFFEVM